MSRFQKATRQAIKLRLALEGVSGSGKTYTALEIASAFGDKILVLDTENGSANRYAGGKIEFWSENIEPPFRPAKLIELIEAAEAEGFDVVIVDSLTHFWRGKGGILDMVEDVKAANRKKGNANGYTAWKNGNDYFLEMLEKIIRCKIHIICTMRSKAEYLQTEDDKGRKRIEKMGTAPEVRDGLEYEFDVVFDLDLNHDATISKSRCSDLPTLIRRPDRRLGEQLKAWCELGVSPPEPEATKSSAKDPNDRLVRSLKSDDRNRLLARLWALAAAMTGEGQKETEARVYSYAEKAELLAIDPDKNRPSLGASTVGQVKTLIAHIEAKLKSKKEAKDGQA